MLPSKDKADQSVCFWILVLLAQELSLSAGPPSGCPRLEKSQSILLLPSERGEGHQSMTASKAVRWFCELLVICVCLKHPNTASNEYKDKMTPQTSQTIPLFMKLCCGSLLNMGTELKTHYRNTKNNSPKMP